MTDTEIAADHVDLSAEEDGAGTGAEYWERSTAIHETTAPEVSMDAGGAAPPMEERRERPKLFVTLGHVFSGGPNGR